MKTLALIAAVGLLVSGTAVADYLSVSNIPYPLNHPWLVSHKSYDEWASEEVNKYLPGGFWHLPIAEQKFVYLKIFEQNKVLHRIANIAKGKEDKKWRAMQIAHYKKLAKYEYGTPQYHHYETKIDEYGFDNAVSPLGHMFEYSSLKSAVRGYAIRFEHDWRMSHPGEAALQAKAQQAKKNQRLAALFGQEIQRRVYRAWNNTFAASLKCEVEIYLTPNGDILGHPAVLGDETHPKFNEAVVHAVEAAAPFIPPAGLPYSTFKSVVIKFNAESLNHA